MFVKIILLAIFPLFFHVIISASAYSATNLGNDSSNFAPEEECGLAGGNACVFQSECDSHSTLDYKILDQCTLQKKDGAVCCKNYPTEKMNCKHLHNDCRSSENCNKKFILGQRGCPSGEICCTLL